MRFIIASDIHGSAEWCKKLVDAFENEQAEKLLLLGDLLYHGPRNPLPDGYAPAKVVELLSTIKDKIICVRGNCDSEVDSLVLEFPVEADFAFFPLFGRTAIATHGHKTPACLGNGDVLFNGHFHVPAFETRGNYIYVNCGSVSIPKENSPHSCLVAEDNELVWKDVTTGESFRRESFVKL